MDEVAGSSVGEEDLIAASVDGVGILDRGTFVKANDALATAFGYDDADDVVGTAWTELYPQAERERIEREVFPAVREEKDWRGEVAGVRTDGSRVPHLLSIRAGGTGQSTDRLVWVVRDRSDWDDRTATIGTTEPPAFDESERQFESLVERAPVPLAVFTDERGLVYANRTAIAFLGGEDRADVLGHDPEQFVHPADREQARQRIRRVLEDRTPTEPTTYRLVGLDDGDRVAEIAASPITYEGEQGACVVLNDITPYKRAQANIRRERRFLETVIDAVDDIVYVLDEDGQSYLWNETLVETTGYSNQEIESMHPMHFIPEEHQEHVPGLMEAIEAIEDKRVKLPIRTRDGETINHEFRGTTFEDPETGEVFRCGIARDVTEWLERERRLERQRDELATLDRVNRILLETTRDLIQTADVDVIERTVCTQLANSDLYQFAWVGELAIDGDQIVPRTSAGDDRGLLDAITTETNGDVVEGNPGHRAIETGNVQVADRDNSECTAWKAIASECGFESSAAIPLHHNGTVYGVLLIHTERENAFNDREQDGFDVLGRTIGYIINAVKNRKLLFTDAVRELEFQTADADSVFANIAATLDCELELDGYVASGQRWVLYFEIHGTSVDDVVAIATEDPRVKRARDISVAGGEDRIELTVTNSSVVHTVTGVGGSLSAATVSPDGIRFVVEVPVDADVREIVDHIQAEHADIDFVAQRDLDHDVSTVSRPDGVLGELTDRQREVLEAAYRSGYFAWPRTSTAEEIAESLDLASATLHGHLRKAEAVIISTLFDAT
ncbi:PAS domain S-box protein [Natrinema halophilum]|uniref:PAS domain S-box protein n=1 Tax=Natrinema halophilum TaxID=1699371 RepID=A0A7D5KDC2_9EURY|nr:PAS domain S-box protein [Natrinema halophilum]QLG49281.1 PAS domain S-box protein [Natrinema halophilum]